MRELSNECLLETYYKALDLQLETDFIMLLEQEIERRNLTVDPSLSYH